MAQTRLRAIETFPARNGSPILRIQSETGRLLLLHSGYAPEEEARRWAAETEIEPTDVVFLFGCGAGYPAQAQLDRFGRRNHLLIIEPDPAIPEHSRALPIYRNLVQDRRFSLFDNWNACLRHFEGLENYCWRRIHFLVWPPYRELFPEESEAIRVSVFRQQNRLGAVKNTVFHFAETWQQNLLLNLPSVIQSAPVARCFGRLSRTPVIIVSAGPSLEKNLHLIEQAYGRALIVSTATAARLMALKGLKSDIILTVDPSAYNFTAHFEGIDHGESVLVYDPTVSPKVTESYRGLKALLLLFPDCLWLESFAGEPLGLIKTGGSVSNVAFDLACRLDADPVILIGQDLAFTNNLTHARGTFAHGHTHEVPADWAAGNLEALKAKAHNDALSNRYSAIDRILVRAANGGFVPTDRKLFEYLCWFEREISEIGSRRRVINATEGGALIRGAENLEFQDTLDRYCRTDHSSLHKALIESLRTPPRWNREKLTTAVEDLLPISRQCLDLITRQLQSNLNSAEEAAGMNSCLKNPAAIEELNERILLGVEKLKKRLHFLLTPFLVEAQDLFSEPGRPDTPALQEKRKKLYADLAAKLKSGTQMLEKSIASLKNMKG